MLNIYFDKKTLESMQNGKEKLDILITGTTGFIGSALAKVLSQSGDYNVRGTSRGAGQINIEGVSIHNTRELSEETDWKQVLENIDVIIHTAARVHVMKDPSKDPLSEFRRVNAAGTISLARQAAKMGVQRFIFISTIKVNGEFSQPGTPFTEDMSPEPQGPYGISKLEAENELFKMADDWDMEITVIRPPLVYGPNVKGNFQSIIQWLDKGIPLPLGAVHNKRSLIALRNLIDFIITCIDHPAAANQVFLVSDGKDLSTTDLLYRIGKAINKQARLIPVPAKLLDLGALLMGKQAVAQRLLGSLQIDISKARDLLGWEPPISVNDGLRCCVADMLASKAYEEIKIIRFLDIGFSAVGIILSSPLLLLLLIIGLLDTGYPIFRQKRVGKGKKPFVLIKFRTMKLDTASVASHLASVSSITKFGHFLRCTKLDELPQLWNVLKGEMSLVGPRPCLLNQFELIQTRSARGVFNVRPGITGLAQVNKIDMSTPMLLAETDQKMLKDFSVKKYFHYILMTVSGKGAGDRVKK